MSSDPSVAPGSDLVHNIEGTQSTGPAQSSGLIHRLLDPANNVIRRGRVEDVYMDSMCAIVSVFAYHKNVPMIWLTGAMNRWHGAREVSPPSVGTEVACWVSNDHKFGVILGTLVSVVDGSERPSVSLFHTPVHNQSDQEKHQSEDYGVKGSLLEGGIGQPYDVFPGDSVEMNEMAAGRALLRFVALLRGSGGNAIETFVIDQLTRVTGFNLQIRTSLGEANTFCDNRVISEETSGTPYLKESLGFGEQESDDETSRANEPDLDDTASVGMRRRFQTFKGHLGSLRQWFTLRPNKEPGDLESAGDTPDLGLHQEVTTLAGQSINRSVVGAGLHKCIQVAVPKKTHEVDDPAGDRERKEDQPVPAFEFGSDAGAAGRGMQLRDYFAWIFSRALPHRILEKTKDWAMPDESDCPVAPHNGDPRKLKLGGFFREILPDFPVMGATGECADDSTKDSTLAKGGEAWVHVLPDGSVSIRDAWGSGIEMRGGHVEITASKDIHLFAGGSILNLAGDDIVIRAKESLDITATNNQVRIKSQQELFVHSERGGMLFSLGTVGHKFEGNEGEDRRLPGIGFKIPDGGGFEVIAGQASFNLDNIFWISGNGTGDYPSVLTEVNGIEHWMKGSGSIVTKFDDNNYVLQYEGGVYGTQNVQFEGDCFVKGIGVFTDCTEGHLGSGDWSHVPSLASLMESAFNAKLWESFQYPYSLKDLKDPGLTFCYRRVKDYATSDGKWFETFWQRETDDLKEWNEEPLLQDKFRTYPYPGKEFFEDQKEFWTYQEANVQDGGRPTGRDRMSSGGGKFKGIDWNSVMVHPKR